MALPDFLVIGAPKAGTTALHTALSGHPSLFLSPVKEPKFFLTDGPPPARGGGPGDAQTYREHVWRRAEYEALFSAAPPGTLRGESTPFYLYDRRAHRRIRSLIPRARLIVVLRDPVERAHSNWAHLRSAGLEPIGDFLPACAAEDRRVEAGWADFWHYLRLGRYGEQLDDLFSVFPREQVLILRYRELVDQPARALDSICRFLGVATGVLTGVPKENVTIHPPRSLRHAAMSQLMRAAAATGQYLPSAAAAGITASLERVLQQERRQREPLTWAERQAVLPQLDADIRLLENVTDRDFSDWLGPKLRSGGLVGARPAGQRQARNGRPRSGPSD
jgi:Sulfotransferase family